MNINLEQIDELRKRANVGYIEAKNALEMFGGNLVEALAYLEGEKKMKGNFENQSRDLMDTAKEVLNKGFKTRVLVKKDGCVKLDISANTAVFFGVVAFHATLLLGLLGVATNHKLSVVKHTGEVMNVNENAESAFKSITQGEERK